MLTAALVCIPASPKMEEIKSEAPFITFGCSIKSSVELTKPVSFTQHLILERSPPQATFACEIILSPHLLAALYPSSVVSSFPTLPFISSPFSEIEICPEM